MSDALAALAVIGFDSETEIFEMIGAFAPPEAFSMAWAESIVLIAVANALRAINASSPSPPVEVLTASQERPAFASRVTPGGRCGLCRR